MHAPERGIEHLPELLLDPGHGTAAGTEGEVDQLRFRIFEIDARIFDAELGGRHRELAGAVHELLDLGAGVVFDVEVVDLRGETDVRGHWVLEARQSAGERFPRRVGSPESFLVVTRRKDEADAAYDDTILFLAAHGRRSFERTAADHVPWSSCATSGCRLLRDAFSALLSTVARRR